MSNSKISALTSASTPLAGTEVLPIVQSSATVKATIANIQAAPVSAGIANAVQYLNNSKVPSTASNFLFDGTATATLGDANTGFLKLGLVASYQGKISYDASGNTTTYIDNTYDNAAATIKFRLRTAGTAVTPMTLDGAGNVTVNTGNIIPATAAKGINFTANTPAAGMTSQLLNWYEQGTWTPTIEGSTTTGTATYSVQAGKYTRIGRVVQFQCDVAWSAGTGTGSLTITGLPFSGGTASPLGAGVVSICDGLALTALNYIIGATVYGSSLLIRQAPIGGGANSNVPYDAAAQLQITGTYNV